MSLNQLVLSGANPDMIVVIGYCFGGSGALEVERGHFPVKGIVSFHRGLAKDKDRIVTPITAKVLLYHGADDFFVPEEEVLAVQSEMRETKADWQSISYANSFYSFTDPEAGNDNLKGAGYNEKANNRSWQHLLIFLKEIL